MHQYKRIIVDVHDPRFWRQPLGDLVGVVSGRQPCAYVQELTNALLARQVADCAAEKSAIRTSLDDDDRQHGSNHVASRTVDGVIVLAA